MTNTKIFIYILLLFYFYNFSCYGYIIKDITLLYSSKKYYAAPGGYCQNGYQILCIPEISIGEDCSELTFDANPSFSIDSKVIFSNGTSKAFQVDYNVPIGQYSIVINSIYTIDFECLKLDFNQIGFKQTSNDYFNDQSAGNILIGLYEMTGTDPKVSNSYIVGKVIVSDPNAFCSFSTLDETKLFMISCSGISKLFDATDIKVNVSSGYEYKIFQLHPIVKDNYSVVDYRTFPIQEFLNKLELFGYGQTAILSIKFNTSIDKLYYFIQPNDQLSNTYWFPIYGDENSTTFLYQLSKYSSRLEQEDNFYYLYYIKNSKIENYPNINQIKTSIFNYIKYSLPAPIEIESYFNSLPIINTGFTDSKKYDFHTIQIYVKDMVKDSATTRFPYGYINNLNGGYVYEISNLVKKFSRDNQGFIQYMSNIDGSGGIVNYNPKETFEYGGVPTIHGVEKIKLESDLVLFRINVSTPNGFGIIKLSNKRFIGLESLISGDEFQGIFEYIHTVSLDVNILLTDQLGISVSKISTDISSIIDQNAERYIGLNYIRHFDYSLIQNVSFLKQDIDIRNQTVYNILYFNYTDIIPRDTVFKLIPNGLVLTSNPIYNSVDIRDYYIFTSVYNETIKLFQIEFYINANTEVGEYSFYLIANYHLLPSKALNTRLRIKKSMMDFQGPLFKEITKINSSKEMNILNSIDRIGWKFKIEDEINGFSHGYVTIKGDLDSSLYNVTFNSNDVKSGGNKFLGEYEVKINISYPCISQNYVISQVALYDVMGRISFFSIVDGNNNSPLLNPFLYYLNDPTINKIQVVCSTTDNQVASKDITPPSLDSFSASTDLSGFEIDVASTIGRVIKYTFTVSDPESGLKDNANPIIYLSDSNNQIIECRSKVDTFQTTLAQYSCEIEIPYGFGFPGSIIFSIYGIVNNNGLFSGFTTKHLFEKGYSYYVDTKFSFSSSSTEALVITGTGNNITFRGGNLYLIGLGLNGADRATIKYSDTNTSKLIQIGNKYPTSVQILNVSPTLKPFDIYLENTISYLTSNVYTVIPILFEYKIHKLENCNGNGINSQSGGCICNNKWTTLLYESQCTVPNHYISTSTQVSSTTGGEITLYGWYGNTHQNPSLYINNKQIIIDNSTITSDYFKIIIEPGKIGPVKVNYTQNSISFSGIIYPYLDTEKECPKNCKINGECDKSTGKCVCKLGYTGFDCLSPNNNDGETEVGNNGTTIIKNQDLGFLISIESIVELDINNNAVSTFNLTNNWIFVKKEKLVSTFIQNRPNEDLTIAPIHLIIEEVNDKDKDFTFAGNQFTIKKGGFKLSISISNWLYSSNLNTLQIQMSSDIKITSKDNCNNDNNKAMIESSSSSNYLSDNINYLKVIKNNRVLYSRFQDKMLSNNRITTITTQLLPSDNENSIKIALNIPSKCDDQIGCLIDPDFSLLITPDYKNECDSGSRKWIIAVIVVCGFAFLVIVSISFYLIYKRSTFLKIKVYTFKKYFKNNK